MQGVYIPRFDQISVKFSVLGVLYPNRCNVSPLRGEKLQNRPMSNLNTGAFALCAMLPVNIQSK